MKRIISLILVLLMVMGLCSVTVGAFNYAQNGLSQKYKMEFILAYGLSEEDFDYCRYINILEYNADGSETSDEATPDYILSYFTMGDSSFAYAAEAIGDYVVISNSINSPYEIALFVFSTKDNTVFTLREAWDAQLPRIEEIMNFTGERIGDVNYDDVLNIKDATLIQKALSDIDTIKDDGIPYVTYKEGDPRCISDFNRDGERNIKDATAIQKHIVGLAF
ncbi:MAG: dockerin type I repeat-containing protein [Ruminococcus sp.]|nr:dockerin type I repeat-containing protein [Ruminococcus sp.]